MELFKLKGKISLDGIGKVVSDIGKATESGKKLSPVFSKIGATITTAFKPKAIKDVNASVEKLTRNIKTQQNKLDLLKRKYADLYMTQGKNSREAKECAAEIKKLSGELQKNKQNLEKAKAEANKFDKTLDGAKKTIKETAETAEKSGTTIQNSFSKIGAAAGTLAKAGAAALTAVGTGMVWLSKQAVDSYGDYEQLVGGVETLFKDSADTVQGYAKNAYKTAGLSANEYMETVTSFSASLLQSLGNDTAAAAEMADLAITDMSDNANKMGTDMAAIQNAYNGFAKQNYTMLDNLKLGYGGTKSEMERLLKTANEINERQGIITDYSIESYADIVSAIHVVQTEMGITGTTALEASTTIQGSISSMKSAWSNLLAGISDPDQDLGLLIDNMVETAGTALDNLAPRIINLLPRLTTAIGTLIEKLNQKLPGLIREMLPALLSGAVSLVAGLVAEIPSILSAVWEAIKTTWETLKQEFPFVQDVENVVFEIVRAIGPEGGGLGLIIDELREVFENLSAAVQPAIDKFAAYLENGELVEDITTLIDDAMYLLAGTFKDVKAIINAVVELLPEYCTNGEMAADVMGILEEAVDKVHDAIDFVLTYLFRFSDWCNDNQDVIQTIAIVIGSFAAAWGLVNAAITVWNAISGIATALTTGFGAAVSFLTSPITLVILAIGALITIVVLLVKNWDTVKEAAQTCIDKVVEIWGEIAAWFDKNVVQPIVGFFTETIPEAGGAVVSFFTETIPEALEPIKTAIEDVVQAIVGFFTETIPEAGGAVVSFFTETIPEALETVKTAVVGIWGVIAAWFDENVVQPIVGFFTETIPEAGEAVVSFFTETIPEALEPIKTAIEDVVQAIVGFFTETIPEAGEAVVSFFTETIPEALETVKTAIGDVVQAIVGFFTETIPSAIDSVGEWFETLPERIAYWLGFALGKIVSWVLDAKDYIVEEVPKVIDSIVEFFKELPDKVGEWFDNTIKEIADWLTESGEKISEWFDDTIKNLSDWFTESGEKISEWFDNTIKNLSDWFTESGEKISEWFDNTIKNLSDWFTESGEKISEWFDDTIKNLSDWFTESGEKISEWFDDTIKNLSDWFTEIGEKISEWFDDTKKKIADWFTESGEKISEWFDNTIKNLSDWFTEIGEKVAEELPKKIDEIVTFFSELPGKVGEWLDNTIKEITDWFTEIGEKVAEELPRKIDEIAEWFASLPETIKQIGKDIVDSLFEGISEKWENFKTKVGTLVNSFVGGFNAGLGTNSTSKGVNSTSKGVAANMVDGSHAGGLDFVPFDGYVAELHRGEMVVPAAEARTLRSGYSGTQNGEMASLLKQILNAIEDSNRKETVLKINNREFGRAVRGAVNA